MNITFLIGNGFDIGLGLKSRFKDFFPIYKSFCTEIESSELELVKAINDDEDKWAYFEKQLGTFTKRFTPETDYLFKKQVKHFELKFVDYLKEQQSHLDFSDEEKISKMMIAALSEYYDSSNLHTESSEMIKSTYVDFSAENHTYNFINFNYTDCLEKCLATIPDQTIKQRTFRGEKRFDKIGQVVHVHGFLHKNPIMGLNDCEQIENDDLRTNTRFAKCIVKPLQNDAIRMNFDVQATNLINRSKIICIYGMSLGETDKKWWAAIMSWLLSDKKNQLVVFDYDEDFSESSQFDWPDKEDQIIDRFKSYYNNEELIEKNRKRIHLSVNNNIFSLSLTETFNENAEMAQEHVLTTV